MKYNDKVRIKNVGGFFEGFEGRILGIAVDNVVKMFIVGFDTVQNKGGETFEAIVLPESCLEIV